MGIAELGINALDALAAGLLLYLVAAGLTLVLRTSRFLNLAHAAVVAVGAARAVAAFRLTGSTMAAILLACVAFIPVAMAAELLIVRQFRGKTLASQIAVTFGMSLILGDLTALLARGGPSPPVPDWLSFTVVFPAGFSYPADRLATIVAALIGALVLIYFSRFTRLGARMRALADDPEMSAALGIDPRPSLSGVFSVACVLAVLAGALSVIFLHEPAWSSGGRLLALVLAVVLWGGTGSLRGAFIAALAISFLDQFTRDVLPKLAPDILPGARMPGDTSSAVAIFVATALVLVIRPLGLFGSEKRWEDGW
jgi:branched-chain amino acid transport system permease protein